MRSWRKVGCCLFAALASVMASKCVSATVIPAQIYKHVGLLAQWDGLDNAGTGEHVADATIWKDLVGTRDLPLVAGKAVFTNGNALACLSTSGFSAGPATGCTNYKTIEFVCTPTIGGRFAFCSASGNRAIIFENGGVAGTMNSSGYYQYSGNPTTLAVTYDGDSPSNYYDHVMLLTKSVSSDFWGASNSGLCIGGRHGTETSPYRGHVYAIRLYDHVLTEGELAMNAAYDDIRFFGADPETTFAALGQLPDGFRWNAESKTIEVRVRASAAFGTVSATETWVEAGGMVELAYVSSIAKPKCIWAGCPSSAVYSADRTTVSFSTYEPLEVTVTSCWANSLSAHTYVQRGLIVQFDGIDNAGTGTHDATATAWKDLVGMRDLALTQWGSFKDGKALYCGNTGSSYSAGPADACTTYNTIELSCELGPNMKYVFCAGDTSHSRFFAVYGNRFLVKTGEGCWTTSGGHPTMSATYSGSTPTGHYANGEASTQSGSDTWGQKGNKMVVGAGYSGGAAFVGNVYFIRLYDRALTQDELRFNALIDRIRYDGVAPKDLLPALTNLVAGYTWDESVQALRTRLSAYVPSGTATASGTIDGAVVGGVAVSEMEAQSVVGETVVVDFALPSDCAVRRFVGLPIGATVMERGTGVRVTFAAAGPASLALDAYAAGAGELSVPTSGEAGTTNVVSRNSMSGVCGLHVGNAGDAVGVPVGSVGSAGFVLNGKAEIVADGKAYAFVRSDGGRRLSHGRVVLGDGAKLKLLSDLAIGDLLLVGESSVDLNGHTLTISSKAHENGKGWDSAATISPGTILWRSSPGGVLILR